MKQREIIGSHFFETNPIAMIVLNEECQVIQANLMARLLLNHTPSSTIHPLIDNLKKFVQLPNDKDDMVVFNREVTFKHKTYDQKIFRLHSPFLYSYIIDITDKKEHEKFLISLAHCDTLTGLPNRLQLFEVLNRAISQTKRIKMSIALLYLDIDHFKKINDTLGHDIGDLLLKKIASLLQGAVRKDDLIARIGGDEFAIFLGPMDDPSNAAFVARKILNQLKKPICIKHHEVFISVSIGIAIHSSQDNVSVEKLIQHADMAMYKAKQEGRDQYQFYGKELNIKADRYLIVENNLHHAINKNELFLHFQPIYNAKSKTINSIETLLRWRSSKLGLISPSEYIAVAENSGLIIELGEWILEHAFIEFHNFIKRHNTCQHFDLAINFSVLQFTDNTIYERILTLIDKYQISPHHLIVEITESALMKDIESTKTILSKLVSLGIKIAIDDFGTGYASFRYLQQLPVHIIKIDKSFINNMLKLASDNAIVKTSIILGHELSLKIVAEGVETLEQLNYLKKLNCDLIQGFYFAKPTLIEDIKF